MNEHFKLKYPARTILLHLGVSLFFFLCTAVGLISREIPFILIAPFAFILAIYLIVNIVMANLFGRYFLSLNEKELRLHIWTGDKSIDWSNIAAIRAYKIGNHNAVGIQPLVAEPFRLTPHHILKALTGFRYVFAIDLSTISDSDFKTFINRCITMPGAKKVRV